MPLLQLLEQSEKRYRFFSSKWLPVIVIVILIDLGICLSLNSQNDIWTGDFIVKLLISQAAFWITMFISGFIGYLIWKKRSYPIWKDSKTLLSELKD